MSGPLPKSAATRQRRNKSATASRFETAERPVEQPDLGVHPMRPDWHPRTLEWWTEVWSSPMAKEYLRADISGLVQLAVLEDEFWTAPSQQIAAEIRLQRQCFGLTPIDRRRLQWEIVRVEQAEKRRPTSVAPPVGDPRSVLRAV